MTILDRSSSSHTINFVPRSYDSTGSTTYRVQITNETNNTETYNATATSFAEVDYYRTHTATFGFDANEDMSYILKITDTATSKVIYREKLFVTDQTASSYSVNTGQFTFDTSSTNDYLVYE